MQGNAGGMQGERWLQPAPQWSAIRMANGFIAPNRTASSSSSSSSSSSYEVYQADIQADSELEGKILSSTYSDTYGFGTLTFYNTTHLHYQSIPVTGTVGYDSFWVVKRI